MPVERFASLDAARRALWLDGGDPGLNARLRTQWSFARRLNRFPAPRGVRKFRTIEDANADRETLVQSRVDQLRHERGNA